MQRVLQSNLWGIPTISYAETDESNSWLSREFQNLKILYLTAKQQRKYLVVMIIQLSHINWKQVFPITMYENFPIKDLDIGIGANSPWFFNIVREENTLSCPFYRLMQPIGHTVFFLFISWWPLWTFDRQWEEETIGSWGLA